MSEELGLAAVPTPTGVRILLISLDGKGAARSKVAHVDYTPTQAAEFASKLLAAVGGRAS